ncbi:MAG: patatin-like phospholipase family protein [Myxococcota bacterium]
MAAGRKGSRRPRLGLALGAGGARGIAHIGVLRALEAAEIRVDCIAGTSIGALVGAIYAAGELRRFERQLRAMEWPDVLRLFDPVWPRSGLLSGSRALERLAGSLLDCRIEDLSIPYAAVSVDLITGEEVLIREGPVADAIRASISIPGVFVPHRMGRRLMVDGALRNPVPVSALGELRARVRVAVNLHGRPVREIAGPSRPTPPAPGGSLARRFAETIDQGLARFRRHRQGRDEEEPSGVGPNLFEILTASMTVLEHELTRHRLATDPVDLVLEPDVHGIRSFEFHRARQAIRAGRSEAERLIPELRRILTEPPVRTRPRPQRS